MKIIMVVSGRLLLQGGINYISQGEHGETVFINHRNNLKGYPIDVCYKARFITSDNNGRLWVGTTTGAVAFDENFKKPEDIQFHHSRVSRTIRRV